MSYKVYKEAFSIRLLAFPRNLYLASFERSKNPSKWDNLINVGVLNIFKT